MNKKTLRIIQTILVIGSIISAFEIYNLSALYKDQVDIGYTILEVSGNNSKIRQQEMERLDRELTFQIKLFKVTTIVLGLLIVPIELFRRIKR